ncbi:MAG: glucose-6-phosphate isomerase [Thermoanaerobaculia bacterium]|nr:glucose-6-phosphate isomerase [Thermoanaerobaculia bacterium]
MKEPLETTLAAATHRILTERIVERIWDRDHTVWSPDPAEISDRLGWLDVPLEMLERLPELERIREDVLATGYEDVVLLGMGGSSLGAEALVSCLRGTPGHPRLHVLDSTVPDWVRRVRRSIDPSHTLFIAASKSGGTLEMRALRDYFWGQVETEAQSPAPHFIAITDPGSPLDVLSTEQGYYETFRNPPDIGGRFSILSGFGLLPARLAGVNVAGLLQRAVEMRSRCGPKMPVADNPAVQLGVWMGGLAGVGCDKMTLLTSPRLTAFGLWAEQLVAESTGKGGVGVLPVVDEPATSVEHYRSDRWFVVLRLATDDNRTLDARVESLRSANFPILELPLERSLDLGGQFFQWELATAIAGYLLGVHPFDQPDVQAAKDSAARVLDGLDERGGLPQVEAATDLVEAIEESRPAYVAILAYLDASSRFENRITALRRRLIEQFDVATTFGYGPRYLHSTGQLHKGGANDGLFVELYDSTSVDLAIPEWKEGFGSIAAAQAIGDVIALQESGRPVVRIDVVGEAVETVDHWIARLEPQ